MNYRKLKELYNHVVADSKFDDLLDDSVLLQLEEISSDWKNIDGFDDAETINSIFSSELFSLAWSMLALSLSTELKSESNQAYVTCLRALAATISNNVLAIIKTSRSGFDYQSGVLFRSTLELCFTLLSISIDDEKLYAYFKSAKIVIFTKHGRSTFL
jgi:hypothetical protein